MGELGTKENPFKLCDACSRRNQENIAAYDKANPRATVEDWERFFGRNLEWQLGQQMKHCSQPRI